MVKFTNRASVEAWCAGRTREEVVIFAALNAASVFPRLVRYSRTISGSGDLPSSRAILVAFVGSKYAEIGVRFAASSTAAAAAAAGSADAAANAAATADFSSISSFVSEATAFAAAYSRELSYQRFTIANSIASRIELAGGAAAMNLPLWDSSLPDSILEDWKTLRRERSKDLKVWGFWIDWYEGLLEGRAPDWELWREVALIDDAIWQDGPEAVSEAIEEIKSRLAPPVLPPEIVTAQARRLLAQPVTTKLIANDAADQLEAAIAAHLAVANGLPEELKRLHALPALLRSMAKSSQSAEHIAALEAQIVQLVGETLGLSLDVQGLRFELSQQKGPTGWAIYREQALKTSAILSVGGAAATVVAALSYLTGITGIETAVERFGDFATWIAEETPQLEKAVEAYQSAQNAPIDV